MKIFILIISFVLGSNIDVNISPIDINHDNQQRETIKREKVNRNQGKNVPSGYQKKGDGQYAYGKWFISFSFAGGQWLYGNYIENNCTTTTYGLDNYSRYEWGDFSITIANTSIPFELYQTSDRKGYFANSKLNGQCVTIGVYKSGRYALSSSFDYKKHITKIYEYIYLNN